MPRSAPPARSALLLAALLLAAPAAHGRAAQKAATPAVRGAPAAKPTPAQLSDAEDLLGGRLFAFGDPFAAVAPTGTAGVHHFTFNGTGTAWQEPFLIGVPRVPLSPAPLLVLFHGFGVSEWDCFRNTGLMKRAMERGWYVLAPRGAHDLNFSIDYAQENIEFVLDWLLAVATIDRARIYGVGFSMGGGGLTSYAARHLDPTRAMFAALVNHTGTVSIRHVYDNSAPAGQAILEHPLMFGGPPSAFPFAYQRASVIDLNYLDGSIDPTTDLARNLKHVPIQHWSATFDPLAYLLVQTNSVHTWLLGLGAASERVEVISTEHTWRILSETAVLDYLESKTLVLPAEGTHRLLADRDGPYLHFQVEQDAPGSFTPVRWNKSSALNRIVVDQTRNLKRLTVRTSSIGLNTTISLSVIPGTQDGSAEELAFDGYPNPPSDVLRNGVSNPNWSYDPSQGVVVLYEASAAGYPQWLIVP